MNSRMTQLLISISFVVQLPLFAAAKMTTFQSASEKIEQAAQQSHTYGEFVDKIAPHLGKTASDYFRSRLGELKSQPLTAMARQGDQISFEAQGRKHILKFRDAEKGSFLVNGTPFVFQRDQFLKTGIDDLQKLLISRKARHSFFIPRADAIGMVPIAVAGVAWFMGVFIYSYSSLNDLDHCNEYAAKVSSYLSMNMGKQVETITKPLCGTDQREFLIQLKGEKRPHRISWYANGEPNSFTVIDKTTDDSSKEDRTLFELRDGKVIRITTHAGSPSRAILLPHGETDAAFRKGLEAFEQFGGYASSLAMGDMCGRCAEKLSTLKLPSHPEDAQNGSSKAVTPASPNPGTQ